jgi:Fuc2NAc and GlcNAc transferase
VGVVNAVWLFPIAMLVATGRVDGLVGVLVAYVPLGVVAVRMGAGKPFVQQSAS